MRRRAQHAACQFLDEQRDAISLFDDLIEQRLGDAAAVQEIPDHRLHFGVRQSGERMVVVFVWAIHAGRNSGRHDTMSNTRAWSMRLMISSSSSSVDGSSQCASSKMQSVGRLYGKRQQHVHERAYRPVLDLLRRQAG